MWHIGFLSIGQYCGHFDVLIKQIFHNKNR
jgi:hypothetical protein